MEPKLGTPISSADWESGAAPTIAYVPRAEYAWDTGPAIGRYLEGLRQGVIWGRSCHQCGRTFVPPRSMCELCFRTPDEWVELSPTGTVNTFSLCYVTWNMEWVTEPQMPAVIEIDGATPGHGIMHLLGEVDPGDVAVGMKVEAVWKPADERTGAITDITHWRPQ